MSLSTNPDDPDLNQPGHGDTQPENDPHHEPVDEDREDQADLDKFLTRGPRT